MAKRIDDDHASLTKEFRNRSQRRRARLRDESEAEARGAGTRRRNDLLPDLQLVRTPIARLKGARRKLHKDDERQVQDIVTSFKAFGVSRPILISGDRTIVDGHTTVEAARRLGLEEIPAVVVDHLDETELRLFRLAINRLPQKAVWDLNELKLEFSELIALDAPIELSGFSLPEIDQILFEDEQEGPEPFDLEPELDDEPVTRAGDLWQLDDHRIICGNALCEADYDTLLGDERVRLVMTDVPYNVPVQGHITRGDHAEFRMASGEMSAEEFLAFNAIWMRLCLAALLPGGLLATFIDWRGVNTILNAAASLGMWLLNIVVWGKTNAGMGSLWRSQHELLPVFKVDNEPHVNNVELGAHGRWRSNLWTAPGASSLGSDSREGLKVHPTVKPTALLEDALLDITHPGDAVLDPFLGSGSMILAAENTGRRGFGIELEERYVDVAIRRWEQRTGRSAILAETGETFAQVAARRLATDEGEMTRLPKPLAQLTPPADGGGR